MKKFFKWAGIVLGSLLVLLAVSFFILAAKGKSMINKTYDVQVENVTIPTDAEAIARGEHWVKAECIGCHGDDLSGGPFFEAPFGYFDAINLTPGEGGIGGEFTDEDWVRALRHGVKPDGHSLLIMPSNYFRHYSDEDLGDIIAYLKSLPPVDRETRAPNFNLLGQALLGAGAFGDGIIVAENIVTHPITPTYPPAGITPEYGKYIVTVSGCQDCHGEQLSGGKSPDPSAIYAPNLTSGGEMVAWNEGDFIKAIRTGVTLSGHQLDPAQMPWEHFRYFSDDELKAIWAYLDSLPPLDSVAP
jgi:mono/diheme cytochrome c family protein